MKTKKQKKQRGVALLLAIVALLLLSAAGLALLFSSDTETAISVNYRDKQVAIYAALAGIEEARARINAAYGDLAPYAPQSLPSAGAPNILYIINPGPGETVDTIAPWAPTVGGRPNPYFDTELCQENLAGFGMTGTAGVPCDPANGGAPPSGNSWYQVIDVSNPPSSDGNTWKLKTPSGTADPIKYKWVRVVVKADNMTPAKVGTGVGKQVCWAAPHQFQITSNLGTNCQPPMNRGITNIAITNKGSGYTSPPTVSISGAGGATASAEIGPVSGAVVKVTPVGEGSGYNTTPNVNLVSLDTGAGASAVASVGYGKPVKSVNLSTTGGNPPCYPQGSTLKPVFDSTNSVGGSTADGTVQLTGPRCIYSITAVNMCQPNTTYTISAGSGSGFSGTVITGDKDKGNVTIGSSIVNDPGNGYTSKPTFSSSPNCNNMAITAQLGVQVSGVTVTTGGSYSVAPGVTITGGTTVGTGKVTGTSVLDGTPDFDGKVHSYSVTSSGSGYSVAPTVVVDPPPVGGTQATATATLGDTNGVTKINWTPGSGYTTAPTITIGPPPAGGTQATAIASIGAGGPTGSGRVYLITAMAATPSGSRAMAQMEVAEAYETTQFNLQIGGAVTLLGPNAIFGQPKAQNFQMNGIDANSCNDPTKSNKPALGVMDKSSVDAIIASLNKPYNYIGVTGTTPDIENVSAVMGNPTPAGLDAFANSIASVATNKYGSNPSSIALGSESNPVINYVNGDYTMGPDSGYGILLVTGTLTFKGNYDWHGLILVIGKGASIMSGGGNGQVTGAVFVANTATGTTTTLGQPNADWSGGGGNGVQYDHCWADNLLGKIPLVPTPVNSPLKVISLRFLDL